MQQALNDLKAIPGVVGAAIFHAQQGVLANNLPSIFKQEKLAGIGKLLNKNFQCRPSQLYRSGRNKHLL